MNDTWEQQELPLDSPPSHSHYTIEARRGPLFQEDEVLRTHKAGNKTDAEDLIWACRDYFEEREKVEWEAESPDDAGFLKGLGPGGTVYMIQVTPPLHVPLG